MRRVGSSGVPLIGSSAVLGEVDTPRARRNDPIRSHEAADSNDVNRSLGLVLSILLNARTPMTDEEIEFQAVFGRHSEFTGQRLRTARRHLQRLELVEKAEKVGETSHGRRCSTWQAVKS